MYLVGGGGGVDEPIQRHKIPIDRVLFRFQWKVFLRNVRKIILVSQKTLSLSASMAMACKT